MAHIALLVAAHESSNDVKPGAVLRQSIAAGQHVSREYPVSIVIADEIPKVPNLSDLTVPEATQRLEQKGFTLAVVERSPTQRSPWDTSSIKLPRPIPHRPKGSTVTVEVSGGPGDVEVPKVIGVGLAKATTDLEKLGVKVTG